jgi:O-antigen/teichoic acid export membrane protein
LYLSILTIGAIFLFLISGFVIRLLYGEGHDTSIEILRILAFSLLFEPLGGFFTAYLSLKSEYKVIRSITFKTMLLNLVLVVPMILLFEAKGTAYLFILLSLVQVYLNLKHNREIISFRWSK